MPALTSEQALQELMAGNQRQLSGAPAFRNATADRRRTAVEGQHPIAVIVGCSDSRVPPEIIFDQGIGGLFVIRVAGHVVDDVVLASVEFGVREVGAPLVMVLGHSRCAAVEAAARGGDASGHLACLMSALGPAVKKAATQRGDRLEDAIRANVALAVTQLRSSQPILKELVEKGRLRIVGALYDLESGAVQVLLP